MTKSSAPELGKRISSMLHSHVFANMSQEEIEFEITRDMMELLDGKKFEIDEVRNR